MRFSRVRSRSAHEVAPGGDPGTAFDVLRSHPFPEEPKAGNGSFPRLSAEPQVLAVATRRNVPPRFLARHHTARRSDDTKGGRTRAGCSPATLTHSPQAAAVDPEILDNLAPATRDGSGRGCLKDPWWFRRDRYSQRTPPAGS